MAVDDEITDAEALRYLDGVPARQRHNADALLYANNSISRERALALTDVWLSASRAEVIDGRC